MAATAVAQVSSLNAYSPDEVSDWPFGYYMGCTK